MGSFRAKRLTATLLTVALIGCGYGFKQSTNPLRKKGIRTIYVEPITNDTYKAGVENLVYNRLIRIISVRGGIRMVRDKDRADAILKGTVTYADYAAAVYTTANQIEPLGTGPSDVLIASLYQAVLTCQFNLEKRNVSKTSVWGSSFSRAKQFSASNRLGVLGTTSALINDSEFERALEDLAESMVGDVHESMIAMF